MRALMTAGLFGLALAGHAVAQDAEPEAPDTSWTGEGSLTAGISTGNAETVDLGLALKLNKAAGAWNFAAEGSYDYGEVEGVESRNRYLVGGQAGRDITDRLFGLGRASYEEDDFSGFESRLFIGLGAGYRIFKRDGLAWTIEASPGFRIDELADVVDPVTGAVVTPGTSEEAIGLRGASNFAYDFNERVGFTNRSNVTWTDETTQLTNTAALNSSLTEALSARISFEVRHDTNPPAGFEATDTATRLAIVYGF